MSPSTTVRPGELDDLRKVLGAAAAGRFAAVDLSGDPGTGKTQLLTECSREASQQGLPVLRAECWETHRSTPFHPFLQAFTAWSAAGAPASVAGLVDLMADGAARSDDFLRRGRHLAAVRKAMQECVADAPHGLLVLLDDCQWADPASVELLQSLIRWPVEGGLGLIVAYRPRQASAEFRAALREGDAGVVTLPALTLRQSAELLGAAPDDPGLIRLHRRSAGNPLRLAALAALETADDPADVWEQYGLGAKLASETALLDDRTRLVARAAAILDETFDVDAVTAIAETSRDEACDGLGRLRRRELITPAAPGAYTFRDPLLRLWLYSSADSCWRSGAHRRALRHLFGRAAPATELAPHIERTGSVNGGWDLRILTAAARTAARSGRSADAARWLSAAFRLQRTCRPVLPTLGPEQWRPVLRALVATGDARRVAALARDVLAADGPAPDRPATVLLLAGALAALGSGDEAAAVVNAELGPHGTAGGPVQSAALRVHLQLGKVLIGLAPDRADVEMLCRGMPDSEPPVAGALALRGLCALSEGDVPATEHALARSAAVLDAAGPDRAADDQECLYLLVLSWAEALLGRYRLAAGHAERALHGVRERGDTHLLAPLLNTLAYVHYQSGRMTEALDLAQQGRVHARSTGRADHENFSEAITAAAWARLNHGAGAPAPRPDGATPHTALNALLLAESHLVAGEREAALALLLPRRNAPWVLEPEPVLAPRGYELLAAAALDGGTRPDVIAGWAAQAADAAAVLGRPESDGHALLARGHLLISRGLPTEAAQCYEQALAVLGPETPAGVRARELAGAAASASAPSDVFGRLTLREREVARLAGRGRRSREIAEQLRVSRRTVEAHLGRIYHKLGVTSRAELARLVAQAA